MKKLIFALLFSMFAIQNVHADWTPQGKSASDEALIPDIFTAAVDDFSINVPATRPYFDAAYGYAIFPTVAKGGMIAGGAFGEGYVYEKGQPIGSTKLFQLSIGFQFGAQGFSELIFFKDKASLDRFTAENFAFGAQASAVAANLGATADVAFNNGMAVFTKIKGGLMYEASISGQKFTFKRAE